MKTILILGPGCANCARLEKETRKAVEALGLDARIEKVTDYARIASYGIMSTPGLVVDGEVISYGKILPAEQIVSLLTD